MPVTCGKRDEEISQRDQYALGGVGRKYWDFRDNAALSWIKPGRILDAGCGEGITLEKISAAFPDSEVTGIDGDPENVRICGEHGLHVERADIYSLPFEQGHFTTCVFMEVIEHLEEPERAVSELVRVTAEGGIIIVVYPVDWAMYMARIICGRFHEASFDPGHLRQWNRWELKALLKSCGCGITACRALPLPWPATLHGLVVGEKKHRE